MSPKRSRSGSRNRNTTMIATRMNCQNCTTVMPSECDYHAKRNGHWGASLERRGPISYLVEANGKHYRRNRKWLRATPEELPESVETNLELTDPTELVESSPAELPQPMIPSSPVVSGPHTEGRPVRDRRPSAWLKDYEC